MFIFKAMEGDCLVLLGKLVTSCLLCVCVWHCSGNNNKTNGWWLIGNGLSALFVPSSSPSAVVGGFMAWHELVLSLARAGWTEGGLEGVCGTPQSWECSHN